MIIDFHTHIVSPRIKQNRDVYAASDHNFAALYADPKAKLITAEELIMNMDKDGVDISVALSYGWSTQTLCKEINAYILESVARYPNRLAGFCTVALDAGDAALEEAERCLKAGAKGIGELRPDMMFIGGNWWETMRPLVELVCLSKSMMLIHSSEAVGHQYPGKGEVRPETIYQVVTKFPDLTLICAHWGGGLPFYALMPEVKTALKNVYFDSAASLFLYSPQIWGQVTELIGEDKILFGTDYPLITPRRFFKEINGVGLSPATKEKILGGNAQKLLGLSF